MAHYALSMTEEFWNDLFNLPPATNKKARRVLGQMMHDPWSQQLHPERVRQAEYGVHSSRVDDSYRLIWKHIKPNHVVFCLVDKHDEAYRRARRKSFALKDGIVSVADIVEIGARPPSEQELFGWQRPKRDGVGVLFAGYRDKELLDMSVPQDLLPNIRVLDDVNQLALVERLLPEDVFDRLLRIALGEVERPHVADSALRESLEKHGGGDDLYLFVRSEEFKRAIQGDMENWMLFLAPSQREIVTRNYQGPARVKGVVGSGKTVVAIHRARRLAQKIGGKGAVLFMTFGNRLPQVTRHLLERLAGPDAPELATIQCVTVHQWCGGFLRENGLAPNVDGEAVRSAMRQAFGECSRQFPTLNALWGRGSSYLTDEIKYAIKGRAIDSLDGYLRLERSGRGTALGEAERKAVWAVYETYQKQLDILGVWDWEDFVLRALRLVKQGALNRQYQAAVVDEIQDLTEATMRLLRGIVRSGPNDLFLVGDGLQRLFPGGYVLSRVGIDIIGRGHLLRRNYRNTQEILRAAFAMMEGVRFNDLDDETSVVEEPEYSPRRGPVPNLHGFGTPEAELDWVRSEIERLVADEQYGPGDFVILYRFRRPYRKLIIRHLQDKYAPVELAKDSGTYFGPGVKHSTFDSAKGLEFKVVFLVGVADGRFVPRDDWRLEGAELEDHLSRERSRLFVAMTRARDRLYLSYSRGQPSRFLANLPGDYLASKRHG